MHLGKIRVDGSDELPTMLRGPLELRRVIAFIESIHVLEPEFDDALDRKLVIMNRNAIDDTVDNEVLRITNPGYNRAWYVPFRYERPTIGTSTPRRSHRQLDP